MRYVNTQNPNLRVLVSRGPTVPKGENQNVREDKFVQFLFGLAETDDPRAIEVLDARADCVREEELNKIKGYVADADVEAEIERRVALRLGDVHVVENQDSPIPEKTKGPSNWEKCNQCGKKVNGHRTLLLHYAEHDRANNKEQSATG